jgi:hypothetical protein
VIEPRALLGPVRRIHEAIRDAVVGAFEAGGEALEEVAREAEGDTIYAVDRVSEERLLELVEKEIAPLATVLLIAEGLPPEGIVVPAGRTRSEAAVRVIVDPIDGTPPTLRDVVLAVQTELPLVKQHLSDTLWAIRGEGMGAERRDRTTGERRALRLRPSEARTIAHGFAMVSRFFPGAREELAAIDEEIVAAALGPVSPGKAHCFEDQYICTGGQLYELVAGHDRFVADLRPLMEKVLARRGLALGICCHPYDLCTELIAREAGVIVTGVEGRPLDAPLTVDADVAWVGYANEAIRAQIAPLLTAALRRRGLL